MSEHRKPINIKEYYTKSSKSSDDSYYLPCIQSELDRRITLIVESVVGSFLSGDNPESTSFRHVLNRVMVLLQMPLTFILCKQEGKDDSIYYRERYRFNNHPRDKLDIDRCLKECIDDKQKSGFFRLFGTPFYVIAIVIGKSDSGIRSFEVLERTSTPLTTDGLVAYQFEEILNEKRYVSYGRNFKNFITNSIKACIANYRIPLHKEKTCLCENGKYLHFLVRKSIRQLTLKNSDFILKKRIVLKTTADKLEKFKEKNRKPDIKIDALFEVEEIQKKMLLSNKDYGRVPRLTENGYLDRIFRKIRDNLAAITRLTNSTSHISIDSLKEKPAPANYVIFTRDYRENTPGKHYQRHGIYDYRVKIALCDKQKNDIREYLSRIKGQRENLASYETKLDRNFCDNFPKIAELAHELDDYFWSRIDSKDEDGNFSFFIKILEDYFGLQARSASDIVFVEGVIHFRRPFADGGIGRCFPKTALENIPASLSEIKDRRSEFGDIENDLIRMVICYYWFQGMTAKFEQNNNTELGIMLIPVEIGNRIWSVIGYFTSLYKVGENKDEIEMETNKEAWDINYHIFQDVHDRLKKDIRQSMAHCYRDMLAHYYSESIDPVNLKETFAGTSSEKQRIEKLETWINMKFGALTPFFSYDQVTLKIKEKEGGPAGKKVSVASDEKFTDPQNCHNITSSSSDSREDGAYLTHEYHCDIHTDVQNFFYPNAPVSSQQRKIDQNGNVPEKPYNFVNENDIKVRLTDSIVRKFWQLPKDNEPIEPPNSGRIESSDI
jgi:hypothetical protein